MYYFKSNIVSIILAKCSEIVLCKVSAILAKLVTVHLVKEAKANGKTPIS